MPGRRGNGRIGALPAQMPLAEFTAHAARALPATSWGVRAAGHPARPVRTVAVCGGVGSPFVELARAAGADVFLTSDLKHHHVVEAVTERADDPFGGMALVDAAHWATEAPWLDALAAALGERFGTTVEVRVSRQVTDPWTLHVRSPNEPR